MKSKEAKAFRFNRKAADKFIEERILMKNLLKYALNKVLSIEDKIMNFSQTRILSKLNKTQKSFFLLKKNGKKGDTLISRLIFDFLILTKGDLGNSSHKITSQQAAEIGINRENIKTFFLELNRKLPEDIEIFFNELPGLDYKTGDSEAIAIQFNTPKERY